MVSYTTALPGIHSAKKAVYGGAGASGKLLFPVGHKTHGKTGNESWVISASWCREKSVGHLRAARPSWLHLSERGVLSCKMKIPIPVLRTPLGESSSGGHLLNTCSKMQLLRTLDSRKSRPPPGADGLAT